MRKRILTPAATLLIASVALAGVYNPWTTWYRHGLLFGGMQLIGMRSWLDKHALHDPYVARPMQNTVCGPETLTARTADGTCNNLKDPSEGAAGVRFGRNSVLSASMPERTEDLLTPDPRQLSLDLLSRGDFKPIPFLNMLAATWIQFMVHDWVSHNQNSELDPFILPLSLGDPSGLKEMMILRTRPDSSRTDADADLPATYQNEVTHWWDGSQIYGSDLAAQKSLRAGRDGLMKIGTDGRLPTDSDGVEIAGFKRNWWSGIAIMHTLFVLEHNSIAERLRASHPDWNDQALFDHARLVNTAVMAKIHTVEWTPAILPNPILKQGMNANWFGLLNQSRKGVTLAVPFLKRLDPVLDGIVGAATHNWDVPYSLTEEFVSVYRMHSLLPETIKIQSAASGGLLEEVPLPAMRDSQSPDVIKRHTLTDLFYSMGVSHPGALTLNNYPKFMQTLEVPVVGQTDMGATDILRDRERGIPRYNEFRRQLHLKPLRQFEELTDDASVVAKLKRFYGGDIEKIDLMIGCLAEGHRPTGFGFGETQFQIFLLMASRRLQADRFFTTSYNKDVYTQEGLDWVDAATLKSVLLRHYPGLGAALEGVDNAFNPWQAAGGGS